MPEFPGIISTFSGWTGLSLQEELVGGIPLDEVRRPSEKLGPCFLPAALTMQIGCNHGLPDGNVNGPLHLVWQ